MARRLIEAGHSLTVHTRTPHKANGLLELGARWATGPAEAARGARFVFSMLGVPADVREVVLGKGGLLEALEEGAILIDMTTSEPALAVSIAERSAERGVASLDAPVSGGDIGARNGTLSIMVGGSEAAFRAALPLFEILGKTIRHQGPAGAGQHTKLVNQMLIAPLMIGVVEALSYAKHAGLDGERVLESVGSGAAGSWAIDHLGPRILARDFEAGFFVDHFVKDLRIARQAASEYGLRLPGLELGERLYTALAQRGFGRKGTQALMLELEHLQQHQRPE